MPESTRSRRALAALRWGVSILLAIHGWARLLAGGVEPFGGWLEAQGIPFGPGVAWGVTAVEILGTPLLALGRFVTPLSLLYSAILLGGIVLVHAPEGWFVVGLGRNGVEYSVLLITCLLCLAYVHRPTATGADRG